MMMQTSLVRLPVLPVVLVGLLVAVCPVRAQFGPPEGGQGGDPFGAGFAEDEVVTVQGQFTQATPDAPARLFVTARMAPGWHIYSITQADGGPIRTRIKIEASDAYELLGEFRAISPPEEKQEGFWNDPNLITEIHHDSVTWYAPIRFAPGVDPATLRIEGRVYAQACKTSCLMPQDYFFTAVRGEGMDVPEEVAAGAGAAGPAVPPLDIGALAVQLGFAFLGGLILNLMPCVLPVISLKILSFLQQAGESRARVFMLNVWYALGLISVFMVLAFLAASAGLAWGEQFTLPWFKVAMTGLVFVMALSFLDVWELPIPGFAGGSRAGQLQAKEGIGGAFFKGVFTTILATPCSGPFLGPVFAYLLRQPPVAAYLIFGAVGLGMASPYLLIGAFPRLIRFLPKPGPWMDVLKHLMAFLLLGTVVYLFTTLSAAYFVPTLTLLVGLWFACWWIGRTPITAGLGWKITAWGGGNCCAALIGVFAFTVLLYESKMPWQPFSPDALAQARAEGKTVMVDFTADWCLTCKTNLKLAIDTKRVRKLVDENGVVPMLADWTNESPVIKKALNDLGYNSIPLLAIWPAEAPEREVVILTDLLREGQVLEALQRAGPSKGEPAKGETTPKPPRLTGPFPPVVR
jgi:thiol:disulfide interchange protein